MELKLITCNIRFDNPADGVHAWPHRRALLKDTLLKYSPHIIATQEGRFDQLKDFSELLQDYILVDQHRSWIKERMYPTFYLRKGVFEILKSEDLWLSETPEISGSKSFDSAFPRLFTWIKIQPINSRKNILIVNTHLDHVKVETRIEQARVLSNEAKRVWNNECPIIFMGDYNDSPDGDVRKMITDNFPGLQDAWKKYHIHEETSHHAFTGEMQNGERIDWILVDKNITINSCLMDKSHNNGLYPTDHFPVVCEIKL